MIKAFYSVAGGAGAMFGWMVSRDLALNGAWSHVAPGIGAACCVAILYFFSR